MRRRVFLAVLLALVLSLSKGENDTTNVTTAMTTAPDTTGQNDTTTMTVDPDTPGENDTIYTTTDMTTATDTTGLSSDTSPAPNLMTTTDTTGSSSDISPTPNLTTTTEIPGSPDSLNDASNTTKSADTAGENDNINVTATMTTAPDTTGQNDTTTMTVDPDTPGENDTIYTTTDMTTATDTTGEVDTITATTPTTTAAVATGDFCNPDPCGTNLATCVPLNSTFTCLCQYGFYYREKNCHRGKIFPGITALQGTYDSSVLIVNSVVYEEVFENMTQFFGYAFKNLTGFEQMVIVKIELLTKGRASAGLNVTVMNLFMENTTATNETVKSAVMNATQEFPFVVQYTGTTYCAVYNCDAKTTECEENEFPQCICQSNFSKTEWDTLSCSDCYAECVQTEGKYCVREDGLPKCKCLPNFEDKNGKCVSCAVGFSGDNCKNNSELILIIVGTVFGAIILCLAIAVTVVSIRAKHRQDPEKKKLLRSDYSNPNTSDDRQPPMFPRVRTTTGHPNPGYQPNNPYETRDFDDLYEASREPEGFRMHNRN